MITSPFPHYEFKAQVHVEGQRRILKGTFHACNVIFVGSAEIEGSLCMDDPDVNMLDITHIDIEGMNSYALKGMERNPAVHRGWKVFLTRIPAQPLSADATAIHPMLRPLAEEMAHARTKFPSNDYLFEALGEEIGEMAAAFESEGDTKHARKEALQVACVAMRIYFEGPTSMPGDERTLPAMRNLENMAREFFASMTHRPDLSARSENPA